MPLIITEVTAEIVQSVIEPIETEPAEQQLPLSVAEIELARTMDRIQSRQQRLKVD